MRESAFSLRAAPAHAIMKPKPPACAAVTLFFGGDSPLWALLITLQALVIALTGMYIEYKAHAWAALEAGRGPPVCTGSLFGAVRAVCAFFGIS